MRESGLERGWADAVCWVHRQSDSSLGSYVERIGIDMVVGKGATRY